MKRYKKTCLAHFCKSSLWVLLLAMADAGNAALEEVRLPQQTELRWVGRELIQNNHQMQIAVLDSELSPEAVTDFYADLWRNNTVDGLSLIHI